LAIAVNAAFAIYVIRSDRGPFAFHAVGRTLLNIQVYVLVSGIATLLVAALVREREQLAEGVRASRRRIVAAADEERRRIERNIHDGAQQRLVALAAHLTLAAEQARTHPEGAAGSIESAQNELMLAIDDLRELVQGIRPTVLRQFGLATAVQLAAARSGIPIELDELPSQRLDGNAEATAYYVVLEAITNAQRYANASVVRVNARLVSGRLELEIQDDGIGGAVERDDLGLQGLRDRVEASGGKFSVDSPLGEGTRIAARIPATVIA
jgi:signal transduction histidine kinase